MFARRKRTRNTTTRPKLGSHGFKVYKNTKVYIGESTSGGDSRYGKPAPRQEVVQLVRDMINNDPSIKPMRKHIKAITIIHTKTGHIAGTWNDTENKLTVYDKPDTMSVNDYKSLIVHEVVGHAFWHFSQKWRKEELDNFNKLANSLPPVNTYVKDNEEKWRKWNDTEKNDFIALDKKYGLTEDSNPEYLPNDKFEQYQKEYETLSEKMKTDEYKNMTRYANEQHSAVTELVYGNHYHQKLIDSADESKLIDAWHKLHY